MTDRELTLTDPEKDERVERQVLATTPNLDNSEKSPSAVEGYEGDAAAGRKLGTGEGQISPATSNPAALENAKVDEKDAEWVRSGKKEAVFNPNTGLGVRVGGPFLDDLELEAAERRRAVIENRKPDYTNMAGAAGVPLYTAGQMANAFGGGHPAVAHMIEDNADNDGVGPNPVTHVDLVGYGDQAVFETKKEEQEASRNVDNTKISSHDNPGVVFSDPDASSKVATPDKTD